MLISGRRNGFHYQELDGSNANKALSEWEPIDERLLYARFKSMHVNISMLVCYAPTKNAPDFMIDDFYEKLQEALGRVARHDILLCIGDFNSFEKV